MSQASKKELWDELKAAGVTFPEHYRNYTEAQLQEAVDRLHELQNKPAAPIIFPAQPDPSVPVMGHETPQEMAVEQGYPRGELPLIDPTDPSTVAGMDLNRVPEGEPIGRDKYGQIWYALEVKKPGYAKPRGRRVLDYIDSGSKKVDVFDSNGAVTESFEMPGDQKTKMQVRITLPSYQVGIYRESPDAPFKIHVYNGDRGYDLFDVEAFYGGPDTVPADVKRKYVSNVLCYDIRTVNRAIEAEYREKVLPRENMNVR